MKLGIKFDNDQSQAICVVELLTLSGRSEKHDNVQRKKTLINHKFWDLEKGKNKTMKNSNMFVLVRFSFSFQLDSEHHSENLHIDRSLPHSIIIQS